MTNSAASDAGIGRAVFATRIQLSLQAALMCFWFGAVPFFFLPYILWTSLATQRQVDVVRVHLVAKLVDPGKRSQWEIRNKDGEYRVIEAITSDGRSGRTLTSNQVKVAMGAEWSAVDVFRWYVWSSIFTPVLGYALVWLLLRRIGRTNMEDKRIRGADSLITAKELDRIVKNGDGGPYKLAEVTLPSPSPMMGILIEGAQGSGKSIAIHDLMRQVFAREKKSIIYDESGAFFRAYYRPGKDFFFNPACVGSVPWSIFSELRYTYDSDSLAQSFLPPKAGVVHGANAFFEDAARALFSVLLTRLANYGAVNTRDLATAFFEMPEEEMAMLIEKSVASSAVGGDSKGQRQGVISSISIYLNGIAAVQPGNWSIRNFLDSDDDARFFILGSDDTRAMFAPLYRLLLTSAFAMIASKQEEVHEDKYWFFLDEGLKLGDIKLDEQLATQRKYGVCVVCGIQSESQVSSSVGDERSTTIMNCFNTALMLRMNEVSMQERAAGRLGKMELETVNQNQALAVNEYRDGAGVNIQKKEETLVMASEFGNLQAGTGFLKLAGDYPAAKVDYRHWLPKKKGGRAYVNKFKAVQPSPNRDPKFIIQRSWEAGTVDPLELVRLATKDAADAAAKEAAAKSGSDGGRAPAPVQAAQEAEKSQADCVDISHAVEVEPPARHVKLADPVSEMVNHLEQHGGRD